MSDPRYRNILNALQEGRRALARARLTAGLLRLAGIGLATLAVLVLWAALQRTLHFWSVPAAAAASIAGAGVLVFALVRWVVLPLVRMPDREDFVRLVEQRFPAEKNLIVNAFQLGDDARATQGSAAPDLVDAIVSRAAERLAGLDLRRWRDPAPDRPYLWAAGSGLGAMALLALLAPSLFVGALGQVVRPSDAGPPAVTLTVDPGDVEVDRGGDVPVTVEVRGTDRAPTLYFRERGGAWRAQACSPAGDGAVNRDGGTWAGLLLRVDRPLEYRVASLRNETPVYRVDVREVPRLAGFRAHVRYPAYTGLPTETITGGTGDVAALLGSEVDLRILVNRPVAAGRLEWQDEGAASPREIGLEPADPTTWKAGFRVTGNATYAVVLLDADGAERVRSPRYRVEPVPDRPPFLTLHYPQEDHDLASDMMERVVVDAADDFGFSSVSIVYRVDEGPETRLGYTPFKPGQKDFRLDTLWDLTGLDLLPGSILSYYVEVRDNDTVSGPKAVRSPVRRVRFPTVSEIYEDVAEDHGKEIEGLSDVKESQREIRERLEKLEEDLKRGRDLNWEVRRDVEQAIDQQNALEQQLSEMVRRLEETVDKASNRAQMSQELVLKMEQLNQLLNSLGDEEMKRAFRELSRALEQLDRNALRDALEKVQLSQEEMLRGMERTMELMKQIRRDEQMEDVVQRTDEIARLQEAITKELEKLAEKEKAKSGEPGEDPARTGDREPETAEDVAQAGEREPQAGDPSEESQAGEPSEQDASKEQKPKPSEEPRAGEEDAKSGKESGSEPQEPSESQSAAQNQEGGSEEEKSSGQPALSELAKKQEEAEKLVEELKRLLRQLQKLNEEHDMAKNLEQLEKNEAMQGLSQNMKGAQQGMSGGKPKEASAYAFKALDEAKKLADMARSMQQQMQSSEEESTAESVERVIEGLIDVSRVQEDVARDPEDPRKLAQRQLGLTESAGAMADSLEEVMKRSFTLETPQLKKLEAAINRMGRATRAFEEGSDRVARHEARESASDINEAIVMLMRAHEQMCGGSASGSLSQKMQGLSQGQQNLNRTTREMLERLAQGQRLSQSDEERLAQMAAQQEMIRQGLEEAQEQFSEAKDLLGDMEDLAEEMEESAKGLRQQEVDRRLKERQERILSRLLDAQRSIRQREMSPERQSRTGTLAQRPSPPPIPENMLRKERTLAEDVLRGAGDTYPTQYRKLVEEYFRALSRENRAP